MDLWVKFQPWVNQFKGEIHEEIILWRAQQPSITLVHLFHLLDSLINREIKLRDDPRGSEAKFSL